MTTPNSHIVTPHAQELIRKGQVALAVQSICASYPSVSTQNAMKAATQWAMNAKKATRK